MNRIFLLASQYAIVCFFIIPSNVSATRIKLSSKSSPSSSITNNSYQKRKNIIQNGSNENEIIRDSRRLVKNEEEKQEICKSMIPPSYPPPKNSTCWSYFDPPPIEANQTTIKIPFDKRGCDYLPCQAAVCACDPYCCDVAWDSSCRGFAINNEQNMKNSKKDNSFITGCSASILCCEQNYLSVHYEENNENSHEGMVAKVKEMEKIENASSSSKSSPSSTFLISDNDFMMLSSNVPTASAPKIKREKTSKNDKSDEIINKNYDDNDNLINERFSKPPELIDANDNIIETNYPTKLYENDNIIITKKPISKIPDESDANRISNRPTKISTQQPSQNPSIAENSTSSKTPIRTISTNNEQQELLFPNNNDNKTCNAMMPPSYPPPNNSTCWSYFDNNPKSSISNISTAITITNDTLIQKGCDYKPCEAAVCACDPYCCGIAWDLSCRGYGYYDDNEFDYFVSNCSATYLCCEQQDKTLSPSPSSHTLSSFATTMKPSNVLFTNSPTNDIVTNLSAKTAQQKQVSTMEPSILFTIHNVNTTSQSPTSSSASTFHKDSSSTMSPTTIMPTSIIEKDYNTITLSPTTQSTSSSSIDNKTKIASITKIPKENNVGSYSQEQIHNHSKIITQPLRIIGSILLIITLIIFSSMCALQNYDKYSHLLCCNHNGNASDESNNHNSVGSVYSNLNTHVGIEEMLNDSRSPKSA